MKILVASNGVHRVEILLADSVTGAVEPVELDRVYEISIEGDILIVRQGVRGDVENPWKIYIVPMARVAGVQIIEQPK